jgi:hypothetical protein
MRVKHVFMIAASAVTCLLVASATWADVPPPDAETCLSKKAGDSCQMLGSSQVGLCVMSVCGQTKLPDGGTVTTNCLLCKASATDGGSKPTADAGTKPTADTGTKPPATKDESGCTVGGVNPKVLGPWFLALAISGLLLVLGRRRRR